MLKAALVTLALLFAFTATPATASIEDLSGARRAKKASVKQTARRPAARQRVRAAPMQRAGGRPGEDVCRGDAIRLCRPVLGQGDFAVLACFKARQRSLSRGCRALLVNYGQL
jgi:hypothetical protein